jgi:predicted kinase
MKKPLIIIIAGPPCTGKTTLSKKIAERYSLPLVSKDGIKEVLFDRLGWSNREWSKKIAVASFGILFYFAESLLESGVSFIVEGTFLTEYDTENFLKLKRKYDFDVFQIQCKTKGDILFERFKKRSEYGNRHPGNVETMVLDEKKDVLLMGESEPLALDGELYNMDTTDFERIDYETLFDLINEAIL